VPEYPSAAFFVADALNTKNFPSMPFAGFAVTLPSFKSKNTAIFDFNIII
jgi:hypothetical protein